MVQSNISLLQAIRLLAQTTNSTKVSHFCYGIAKIIEQGRSFSDALTEQATWLDRASLSLIQNAEQTGHLEQTLLAINERNQRKRLLQQQLRKALTYPSVLLLSTLLITGLLIIVVVPQFQEFYQGFGQQLPSLTQQVINLASWLKTSWSLLLVMATALLAISYYLIKTQHFAQAFWQGLLSYLPIIGMLINLKECSNVYTLLNAYLEAGIPLLDALNACRVASKKGAAFI